MGADDPDVMTWTEEPIEATGLTYHAARVAGRVVGIANPGIRAGRVAWQIERRLSRSGM